MIISIASGKGGTGKTTIAVNLALSLPKETVQLIDCDVEEPNSHLFLNPSFHQVTSVGIPVPRIDESKCTYCGQCAQVCEYHAIAVILKSVLVFDELCHGCGACSYLCLKGYFRSGEGDRHHSERKFRWNSICQWSS